MSSSSSFEEIVPRVFADDVIDDDNDSSDDDEGMSITEDLPPVELPDWEVMSLTEIYLHLNPTKAKDQMDLYKYKQRLSAALERPVAVRRNSSDLPK